MKLILINYILTLSILKCCPMVVEAETIKSVNMSRGNKQGIISASCHKGLNSYSGYFPDNLLANKSGFETNDNEKENLEQIYSYITTDEINTYNNKLLIYRSKITWRISDYNSYDRYIHDIKLGQSRIKDIYSVSLSTNINIYIHVDKGDPKIIHSEIINQIIKDCNNTKLKSKYGIEILNIELKLVN